MLARTPPEYISTLSYIHQGETNANGITIKWQATWLGERIGQWLIEVTDHFGDVTSYFADDTTEFAEIGVTVACAIEESRMKFLARAN